MEISITQFLHQGAHFPVGEATTRIDQYVIGGKKEVVQENVGAQGRTQDLLGKEVREVSLENMSMFFVVYSRVICYHRLLAPLAFQSPHLSSRSSKWHQCLNLGVGGVNLGVAKQNDTSPFYSQCGLPLGADTVLLLGSSRRPLRTFYLHEPKIGSRLGNKSQQTNSLYGSMMTNHPFYQSLFS